CSIPRLRQNVQQGGTDMDMPAVGPTVPRGLAAFSLAGRKALVTGGNRGLGYAFTMALADCGASVAFIGRSAAANDAAVKRLAQAGVRAHGISADLSKEEDVAR